MGSTVISAMRYRDPHKMIDWLCDTFGFTRKAVHDDGNGGVAHAELTLGDGMIMLGSARDDDFAKVQKPAVANHLVTQSAYIVVPDADAVYARAKANGAIIVLEISDKDYGGRDFTCRDPEGQVWSIGTYNPWVN
jgi:uncharacterized glyoxalase superfamily protein PhnB